MGKAILKFLGPEIQTVAGSAQLCARQPSGCEAAVHAIEVIMSDPSVEGVLIVDARNAFNSLNRAVMLRNLQVLCTSLAVPAINFYQAMQSSLWVRKPSSLKRVQHTAIRSLWPSMHCPRCPLYQKSPRRISPKLGSPTMLVEEHPSKPFTIGGQNYLKKAQSLDTMLIHQKHGCWQKRNTFRKRKRFSTAVVLTSAPKADLCWAYPLALSLSSMTSSKSKLVSGWQKSRLCPQ